MKMISLYETLYIAFVGKETSIVIWLRQQQEQKEPRLRVVM
jgi:hypothetical protein